MIQQVFKIIPRQRDLHPTKEMWVGESYESREAKIIAANGSVPHANMKFVREVTFEIKKSITINDLRALAVSIKEECVIDCFQISINRHLYESYQMAMSTMILSKLHLPFPQNLNSKWLRYFLTRKYKDNNKIYKQLLEELKHKNLTKEAFSLLRQMTEYTEEMCKTSAR